MEEGFSELLAVFLADSARQYQALDGDWRAGRQDGLHKLAHSLKGCCSNIGAIECASIAAGMERAARAGDWGRFPEQMAAFDSALQRAHDDLRDLV